MIVTALSTIGVRLAAQEPTSNLISGVSLYFDNTYAVGDVTLLDADTTGTCPEFTLHDHRSRDDPRSNRGKSGTARPNR